MRLNNISFLIPFLQLVTALPTSHKSSAEKRSVPEWHYYFGVNAAAHQTKVDDLTAKGYRMISLSTSGSTTSTQYAAIWVQREGPEFSAIHHANQSTYQTWFDKNQANGYVPTQVSVIGQGNATLYAGVMEKLNMTNWSQDCDLDSDRFTGYDQRGQALLQSLKVFTTYGSSEDPRFCAIWHANPDQTKWNRSPLSSKEDFETRLNSETSKPYWHPSFLAVSESAEYAAVFTENSIGAWSAHHGLTSDELESETERQRAEGKYMIQLGSGGSTNNTLYTALYATNDTPFPRTWRIQGEETSGFKDNAAADGKLEQTMKNFMQKTGARQTQISMRKGDNQLYNKAFTWSETDRSTTQVNDTFLLASVTKAFAAAAITSLYESGKLTPDTKVYPLLGYANGNAPDPRQHDVTIQHLVDHQGGTSRDISGDPAFNMRNIALEVNNGAHPLTMTEFVDYMYKQPLDFTPGESSDYSNYGYVLLSYVVQNVTGVPYFEYIQDTIIKPEGLNVIQWLTNPAAHKNDNVVQESKNTGLSALEPLNANPVASVFGGDGEYKETLVGTTGLAASAESLAKFLRKHSAWGTGDRGVGGTRSGTVDGARTFIEQNANGVDWALTINTRDFPNGNADFEDLISSLTYWLYERPELE